MLKVSLLKRCAIPTAVGIKKNRKLKKGKAVQLKKNAPRRPQLTLREPDNMTVLPQYMEDEEYEENLSLNERLDKAFNDPELTSMNVLEDFSSSGEKLSDSQTAMLITKTINDVQREYGTLTITALDMVIEDVERLMEVLQALGHEIRVESVSALIVLHANPTTGPAREVERAFVILQERLPELQQLPPYVMESLLKGCALDDDEEVALQVVEFAIKNNIDLSPLCWSFAISSCNTVTSAEKLTKQAPEYTNKEIQTQIYTSLIKVAAKQQLPKYAENVILQMQELEVPFIDDTYVGWVLAIAATQPAKVGDILAELISQNDSIKPETVDTILQVCLVHAKVAKGDPFTKITIDILDNIEILGFHRHQQILSRMMWIFSKVGLGNKAEKVYRIAKQYSSPSEGHYWELLRNARQAGGEGAKAASQPVEALQERGILYELDDIGNAQPIKEFHPADMVLASTEAKPITNLMSRSFPSSPKL